VLPYEIGKLFHLVILGLMGNPLQKEFMNIYNEPNGTQKLLTYMLDNLSCESPYISLYPSVSVGQVREQLLTRCASVCACVWG